MFLNLIFFSTSLLLAPLHFSRFFFYISLLFLPWLKMRKLFFLKLSFKTNKFSRSLRIKYKFVREFFMKQPPNSIPYSTAISKIYCAVSIFQAKNAHNFPNSTFTSQLVSGKRVEYIGATKRIPLRPFFHFIKRKNYSEAICSFSFSPKNSVHIRILSEI